MLIITKSDDISGRYCEYERSLTNVDDKRPSNSFWDWKLSKYILGGLGVLTLVGVLMLTCMVVVSEIRAVLAFLICFLVNC